MLTHYPCRPLTPLPTPHRRTTDQPRTLPMTPPNSDPRPTTITRKTTSTTKEKRTLTKERTHYTSSWINKYYRSKRQAQQWESKCEELLKANAKLTAQILRRSKVPAAVPAGGGDCNCDLLHTAGKRAAPFITLDDDTPIHPKVAKLVFENIRKLPKRQRSALMKKILPPLSLKRHRLASAASRLVLLHRRTLSTVRSTVTITRLVRTERHRRVVEFLCNPEHSTTMPGKKDTLTRFGVKHQLVYLNEYLYVLLGLYNDQNPGHSCQLTQFQMIRRLNPWIRPVMCSSTAICLCVKHQNFTLRLRAAGIKTLADRVVEGNQLVLFNQTLEKNLAQTQNVSCATWSNVKVPYGHIADKKTVIKLRLIDSTTPTAAFIKSLGAEFVTMAAHTERARTQHRVVRELRENLSLVEVTIQMDFAENWNISYPEEPQSVYYNKEPITVHPVVIHYKDVSGTTKHYCMALTTDDRKHDAGAILAFLRVIVRFITKNLRGIKVLHYVSDSPSSQYRNISIFSVLCRHHELLDGYDATWTYFEAGHGKGPCDGVGAAAKRTADAAVLKFNLIMNAADFARRGNNASEKVYYECIPVVDVECARSTLKTVVAAASVVGTQSVHGAVTAVRNKSIAVRHTSCFKECCWKESKSRRTCDGWKVHQLDFPRPVPRQWLSGAGDAPLFEDQPDNDPPQLYIAPPPGGRLL